jgi:hypothetical protein
MIKINLLPPYVFERQAVQRLMVMFAALLIFIIIAGVAWRTKQGAALADLQTQLAEQQRIAAEVKANQDQANAETAKVGPITEKVKFIDAVLKHNLEAPALYEQLTRFTYEKVRYRSITLSDTQMDIDAYAPSLSDAGRYLLNLYRATDLFSQVTMSAVPGYSAGAAIATPVANKSQVARGRGWVAAVPVKGFDFKVTCTLAKPLSSPSYSGATSGAPGAPGAGAPSGGSPAAPSGGPPTGGGTPGPGAGSGRGT